MCYIMRGLPIFCSVAVILTNKCEVLCVYNIKEITVLGKKEAV